MNSAIGNQQAYSSDKQTSGSPRGEVPGELDRLHKNLQMAGETIAQLEMRLGETVMRPQGPSPQNAAAAPPHSIMTTHYGSQLQEANSGLLSLVDRLQSILTRLEV